MKTDKDMIVKRRFERINNMIESESCNKNEDFPENKEIFGCGFKHIKTDKVDTFLIIGCASYKINGIIKLFNFWSKKIRR